MIDFLRIVSRSTKQGYIVEPKFVVGKNSDLMIRGGDFYAIWIEEIGLWSTDEQDVINIVDRELTKYASEHSGKLGDNVEILYMWDSDSGVADKFHKYCQKQCRDNYHMLDDKLLFSNDPANKKDYSSKRLPYPLEKGECPAYEKIISTLYSEEERHKIEWAIGAIVTGASKSIQKFLVFYGAMGTGKSTIMNIIQQLFEGYWTAFKAKDLGSSNNVFALEAFKNNPLVAIDHDGNLSKIEDNTMLNSLVSHETMLVNEKFKGQYNSAFKCFLLMGTNSPVKITDGKSGLLRRLIDVSPTGNLLSAKEYKQTTEQVKFELGAIAYHCKEVYLKDPDHYDSYRPNNMMGASNDFFNYVIDSYHVFKKEDGTTLKAAWEIYKNYCEEARVPYPFPKRTFKEELKNYFDEFEDKFDADDGTSIRSYYKGFKTDIFEIEKKPGGEKCENNLGDSQSNWLILRDCDSTFDSECSEYYAQYANQYETPIKSWNKVTTKLSQLDTSKLHYVKVPENHIVIDFDIKNAKGEKDHALNLAAASSWPHTYAEVSKGGAGIHLHYIYSGDVNLLSRVFDDNVEIKVFTGNATLRRKLTKCNDLPIATISSGLPLKGEKVIQKDVVATEKGLRTTIKKCLNKEVHAGTKSNVDFIFKILNDAYDSGLKYDVSDLWNPIFAFAANSTHQSEYCMDLVDQMKLKSDEPSDCVEGKDDIPLVFFDCEVFPNLFLVNWKIAGEGKPVVRMINPTPEQIDDLLKFKLVGFNNRRYDNHMIYACLMGYTNEQLYNLSVKIINSQKGSTNSPLFGEAYNLSYTDIYDFASAGNKKSLKKLEIEMGNVSVEKLKKRGHTDEQIRIIKAGTHHKELGLPWDQPVPEDLWEKVAEYCDNDVLATEAAFHYLKGDWTARQILADIAGMTVNDTTNSLSTRVIFGKNKKPQNEFNYRNLAEPVGSDRYREYKEKFGDDYKFRVFNANGLPEYRDYIPFEDLPEGWSILPFFPGYTYEFGKSTYLGQAIGEGGRVYSEPGMYGNVWDGDVTGQHPSSIIAEVLFGPKYTKAFAEIVYGRVSIKHSAWNDVDELFDGKLKPYIQKVIDGELTTKELADALKTVVNSVYGLTSASFINPFRDPRNKDNIVAKRGALFMTLLTREVQKRGFVVAHNKTDSIKIPDATPEIEDFVIKFGNEYGYSFETEARFDRFCLVNDAVYIAKTDDGEWTATGKQFAVPYVFKTLFSHEPIEFGDMCETFAVAKGDLYLDMNENLPDVSELEKALTKLEDQYKKGKLNDTSFEHACKGLPEQIAEGHDLHFVGRVGQFTPIKPGCGGGILYRVNEGKNYAASGSTGFRWMESEIVKASGSDGNIDREFYRKLVDDAVENISKFGDFEWFISEEPYVSPVRPDFMNIPENANEEEGLPWD